MIVPLLIAVLFFLLFLGGGAIIWFVLRQRRVAGRLKPEQRATGGSPLAFRWSYVLLPLLLLLISVILVAFFYGRLPDEVAYHFQGDGSPARWLGRGVIVLWLLLPQFLLAGVAVVLTWGVSRLLARVQSGSDMIVPAGVLPVMGNMIALPQIILGFAMLDIFRYNSYQAHLMPLWVFALIIMVLGGIVLGVFFVRAMWRAFGAGR